MGVRPAHKHLNHCYVGAHNWIEWHDTVILRYWMPWHPVRKWRDRHG